MTKRKPSLIHYATGVGATFRTACGKARVSSYTPRVAGVTCPACLAAIYDDGSDQ